MQITPVTKNLAGPLGRKQARRALMRMGERNGPAAEAGSEAGDVIVRYNGTDVENSNALVDLVSRSKPGTTLPVELVHDGQRKTVQVKVGTLDVDTEGATGEPSDKLTLCPRTAPTG